VSDPVDPWQLHMGADDLEQLAVTESLFSLANGHIGLRGLLDEGEPRARPGTYVNGFYEERPLPHPRPATGSPSPGRPS
jgi:alpha,alpha-trehalose phosphorylase